MAATKSGVTIQMPPGEPAAIATPAQTMPAPA